MAVTAPLPPLSLNMPVVYPQTGRPTAEFHRWWQSIKILADAGSSASGDIAGLQSQITTINGQITTINGTLAGKAPLASPALTGNPTAPTQAAGNNSTRLATTAYVVTHAVARSTFTPWGAPTGTVSRATFATYTAPTASAAYDQTEMQAVMDALQTVSRIAAALVTDLKV